MPRVPHGEHFRRHQFLRLVFQDQSLQIFFALLDLTKQFDVHEYYATDRDYGEQEFLEHRKELDATHPTMRNEVGKSFKLIEGAFITASRAHGITDEQREEIVRRHRSPAPAYASVSEAKQHDSKRGGGSSSNVTIAPIAQRIDKKKFVRAVLATYVGRWRTQTTYATTARRRLYRRRFLSSLLRSRTRRIRHRRQRETIILFVLALVMN